MHTRSRVRLENRKRVDQLIKQEKDAATIARELDISVEVVGEHRRALGYPTFREMKAERRMAEILELLKQGVNREVIAERLDVSTKLVDNHRRQLGLIGKARAKLTDATQDEIWYLRTIEKLTVNQIVERVGVHSTTVCKVVRSRKKGTGYSNKGKSLAPENNPEHGAANRLLMQPWRPGLGVYA